MKKNDRLSPPDNYSHFLKIFEQAKQPFPPLRPLFPRRGQFHIRRDGLSKPSKPMARNHRKE